MTINFRLAANYYFVLFVQMLSRISLKSMAKIPKKELIRIKNRIDTLSIDPRPKDIKKIQREENLYRIRVSDCRILYRIFDEIIYILIIDIDHRKDIYRKYYRLGLWAELVIRWEGRCPSHLTSLLFNAAIDEGSRLQS